MGISTIRGKGLLVMLVVVVLMLTTAAGAATDVGTPDNPVKLSFSSSVPTDPEVQALADALHEATGLEFKVEFPTNGVDGVEWVCDTHPDSSVRIMSAAVYAFADQVCGAETRLKLVRFGSGSYGPEFLVPNDSDLYTLDDLTGLDWYHPRIDSASGYIFPKGLLALAGVLPLSDQVAGDGSHDAVVQAVYDNAVSPGNPAPIFGTVFLGRLQNSPPEIRAAVRVMLESPRIPNDSVVFGPDFPASLRRQIEKALVEMSESPDDTTWEDSVGAYYAATGLEKAKKKEFKFLRSALEAAGIVLEDL